MCRWCRRRLHSSVVCLGEVYPGSNMSRMAASRQGLKAISSALVPEAIERASLSSSSPRSLSANDQELKIRAGPVGGFLYQAFRRAAVALLDIEGVWRILGFVELLQMAHEQLVVQAFAIYEDRSECPPPKPHDSFSRSSAWQRKPRLCTWHSSCHRL